MKTSLFLACVLGNLTIPVWPLSPSYQPPTPLDPKFAASIRFDAEIREVFDRHELSESQWNTLTLMARSLASWNERINVVSRKDIENIIHRHYLPSLAILNLFTPSPDSAAPNLVAGKGPYGHPDPSTMESRTVVALKDELRSLKLPLSGRKADLIERLISHQEATTRSNANSNTFLIGPSVPPVPGSTHSQTLKGARIMDVGTGGGFPGLPLAVACPECHFTLVDCRSKKLEVVRALVQEFGLTNVEVIHGRVEDLPRGPANRFDFVLGRAVTALPAFMSWVQPYVVVKSKRSSLSTTRKGDEREEAPSPWGLERGVLYIKSDLVEEDLRSIGLEAADVSTTPIDHLLFMPTETELKREVTASEVPVTETSARSAASNSNTEGKRSSGYSSVLHIPASAVARARV